MRGVFLLSFICAMFLVNAQEPSLYFEKITVQDGLSHNKVNCIIQDRRGFIWIGTDDGLNRYDGKRFVFSGQGQMIPPAFRVISLPTWLKTRKAAFGYQLPMVD